MIIIKLIGGLGNQLFQYAAGRRLASVHNTKLKLDVSGFETYTLHAYTLNHFRITAPEATDAEITALKGRERKGFAGKIARRLAQFGLWPKKPRYVKEPESGFNFGVLGLPDNIYLEGYWQSEKYFKDREELIRREYVLRAPLSPVSRKASKTILGSNSISIHVRRADYVTDEKSRRTYGILGMEYYDKAIKELAKRIAAPHFFIFSDDIPWIREHFKLGFPASYMDFNGPEKNYEDLHLMSLCKHHIIANSSFSWWGAWLGTNRGKIVFAPEHWFQNRSSDARDRYPKDWITI